MTNITTIYKSQSRDKFTPHTQKQTDISNVIKSVGKYSILLSKIFLGSAAVAVTSTAVGTGIGIALL